MKNIHILPTKSKSVYWVNTIGKLCMGCYIEGKDRVSFYITSDEEIKKEYWCIEGTDKTRKSKPFKVKEINDVSSICRDADGNPYVTDACKKIILTTDTDLIKDGVQSIPNEFLNWFIKNSSCEWVNIKKRFSDFTVEPFVGYRIIIPKKYSEVEYTHYSSVFDWLSKNDYLSDKREVIEKEFEEYLNK